MRLSVYAAYSLCMTYTVQLESLTKTFGQTRALDDVDLRIATGTIYGLLGPNGAGKTTLVRILATLVRPDAGTAVVAGHDLLSDADGVRRSIGLTGQYAAVDDVLTGEENLLMMARLRKLSASAARRRTAELLEEFDLVDAAGRRAGTYSGGMKRRLDLAVSMIERPALLFLDEPTTGLDPRSREQVWATVSQLRAEGVTILLTTQYLEEADRLADLVGVLDGGRIVAEGTPEQLKSTVGAEQVRLELTDRAAYDAARSVFPAAAADPTLLTVGIATDGSATSLAAAPGDRPAPPPRHPSGRHPAPVARRRLPVPHRPPRRGLNRSTQMSLTLHSLADRLSDTALDTRVMVTRSVRRSLRDPEAFFTALMLPVILMLLFVYVFGGAMRTGTSYVDYVVPGLIVLCAGFGAGTTATAVAQDMTNGIVDRFRSMPVSPSSLLTGHVVASLLRNLLATFLVVLVGLAVGWRPTGSPLTGWAPSRVIVLFILALSWLAAAVGLLAGSPEAANSMTIVLMFLPYVSTAFVPADTMPSWLQGFAEHQPMTPVIETLRGLWMGTPLDHQPLWAVVWCVGILAFATAAASMLFARRVSR